MVLKNNNKSGYNLIGQVFTPNYIAKFMVNNLTNFNNLQCEFEEFTAFFSFFV